MLAAEVLVVIVTKLYWQCDCVAQRIFAEEHRLVDGDLIAELAILELGVKSEVSTVVGDRVDRGVAPVRHNRGYDETEILEAPERVAEAIVLSS